MNRFLDRKIKPIYKMIKNTKVSKADQESSDVGGDALGRVEREVSEWVEGQRKENRIAKDDGGLSQAFHWECFS